MIASRVVGLVVLSVGCGASERPPTLGMDAGGVDTGRPDAIGPDAPELPEVEATDVISTGLVIDVTARRGSATVEVRLDGTGRAALAVGGLAVQETRAAAGTAHRLVDGTLQLAGEPEQRVTVEVDYGFEPHDQFDGHLPNGSTLVWPYHCGNLYPCNPNPADGTTFTMTLTGVPDGQTAVYPTAIVRDAPSYMIAWAVEAYTRLDVGSTAAGTQVVLWHRPGEEEAAVGVGPSVLSSFDWLEQTYGAYAFGDEVGAVSVDWGVGLYGGMEHHPYWHVASIAFGDEVVQAHEAAHGWFGDGVRIRCWEDFVLSEGTATYLAARAIEAAGGDADAVWAGYRARLDAAIVSSVAQIAWPDSCGAIDIVEDRYFSDIPYLKGAYFLRALERRIGLEALDAVLRGFYQAHVGSAAGFADLLDAVEAESGYDATGCAAAWLRSEAVPTFDACP